MTSEEWPPPPERDPKVFEDVNQGRLTTGESVWLFMGFFLGFMVGGVIFLGI